MKSPNQMQERKPKVALWYRVVGAVFYTLCLGIAFVIGTGASWIRQSPLLNDMVQTTILAPIFKPKPPQEVFHSDTLTLLILGCDQNVGDTYSYSYKKRIEREFLRTGIRPKLSQKINGTSARTDMMLVAKLDFTNNTITGLSIPRDLEVQLPGYRPQKINGYHTYGKGEEANEITKQAVEAVLPGVHIDRTITLDYRAFQNVVDMVGGVPVDIDEDLKYIDVGGGLYIDLKKGHQVLDGYNAMCFVRFRHSDSDFKRQERQKAFLVSLKNEVMKPGNLMALPSILEQAKLVLGQALTDDEIGGIAAFAKKVPAENIKMGMVPVIEQRHSTNLLVDEAKLPQAMEEFGLTPRYSVPGPS